MAKKPVFRGNPEKKIETEIREFLALRGWLVEKTHSSAYSSGWPDLMCWHPEHGLRWVDVKVKGRYHYTKSQCQTWPKWEGHGLGVWIMVAATEEEYAKLFDRPNFRDYWRNSYNRYIQDPKEVVNSLDKP